MAEKQIKEKTVKKPLAKRSTEKVLAAYDLIKEYTLGDNTIPVIRGISCDFYAGEFVSIMGPSGSGKSTLLYLLSGIESLTSGSIEILGKELTKMTPKQLSHMRANDTSFIFQAYNLIQHFNVYENIITPILIANKKVDEKRVDEVLASVGMTHRKFSPVNVLSGGEQQRVAIARCLITDPKIIFADEATGNLDSRALVDVMNIFRKIANQHKITIIQVTHSERCAQFSDRVITLLDGKIRDIAEVKKFL